MNNIVKYFSSVSDGNMALHILDDEKIVLQNRQKLANKLEMDMDNFLFMNQVHGNKSVIVGKDDMGIGVYKIDDNFNCDSMVTSEKGVVLSVLVADCLPVLFYDEVGGVVGVAHAGWRGTCGKIVENTIKNMQILGSKIDDIKIIIGPGISKNNYEVGEDVGCNFRDEVKSQLKDKKQYLDLFKQNYLDLLEMGVKKDNIEIIDKDTFSDETYFSARRDGFYKGRFGGFIYIK
ncbi:MAG: peptidoglycan editing factor PgeF [Candidatus Gracilibacteria bacterium]|nr:peptidoglycan editing factor PgeF [Candidatus Gracilibacteria bacterium]